MILGGSMSDLVATSISTLALAVSATTAWLTLFRRGTVRMTRPTVVYFGPDAVRHGERVGKPKVYLRALLFATSKRGRVIESMYVSLARAETRQNFSVWVYGEHKELVRGSGLFVGETGIAANHHFLAPEDGTVFPWAAGPHKLSVYVKLVGDTKTLLLFEQILDVSVDAAARLRDSGAGLYFDWGQDSSCYLSHIEERAPTPNTSEFMELLGLDRDPNEPR